MDNPNVTLKEIFGFSAAVIFSILNISILVSEINIELIYYVAISISSMISISSLLICMLTLDIGRASVYNFLSIIFAFTGILKFVAIFIFLGNIYGADSTCKSLQVGLFINFFESFSFVFFAVNIKKGFNTKKEIILRVLILSALIMLLDNRNLIFMNNDLSNIKVSKVIIEIMSILLYSYSVILINKRKKNILSRTRKDLTCFIIMKIFHLILSVIRNLENSNEVVYAHDSSLFWYGTVLIVLINSYYIFKICIADIIKRPNKTLYRELIKEKNRLKDSIYNLEIAKKDLELYNEKYEQLLMSLPDGVIMYEDGKIVFANNKILEFFNLNSSDKLMEISLNDIIVGGLGFDLYELEPFEQGSSYKSRYDFTKSLDRKFGFNEIEFCGKITLFRKNIGQSDLFIAIVVNMDDSIKLKKVENELENSKIMEKTREEILSNISHDLKTPVNVIYSAVQMLELNIQMEKFKSLPDLNLIIKQNCNRLLRLINNFIDSSKIESDNLKVKIKCINIVTLVEDITMSVLPFAQDKNLNLIFDTDDEEIYCEVDIDFIERIMLNLLSNAIKYNSEKGNIDVFIENHSEFVSICVKDTGIGIPDGKLNKLFARFDRIDREPLRHKEGSGIGLNIVKSMIEKLDGSIEVLSEENIGTTMIVNFPISIKEDNEEIDLCQLDQRVLMELSDI